MKCMQCGDELEDEDTLERREGFCSEDCHEGYDKEHNPDERGTL